jgi:hypothetical protein
MMQRLFFLPLALLLGSRGGLSFTPPLVKTAWAPVSAVENAEALGDLGIPVGLRQTLLSNAQNSFSKRIWIVDNSGSMNMLDGHQILEKNSKGNQNKRKDCTRWAELQETVQCHAQLSAALGVPTDFRLLNPPKNGGPQTFEVGYAAEPGGLAFLRRGRRSQKARAFRDCERAQSIMSRNKPTGGTSLHKSIQEIRSEIVQMLPQLKADGMKVAIVIATDGCNHDLSNPASFGQEAAMNQDLLQALESLQGLPVWVVVHLCTDYGNIIDYYNGLDEKLDLELDVLDDYVAEAEEVYEHNKWLNYALILHRMREMGQCDKLFDLLDERAFTKNEIRDFCVLLFGREDLPDPHSDWVGFLDEIDRLQKKEKLHWNPHKKEITPWIDTAELALHG